MSVWPPPEGLAFECTGCGNCCTGSPGYVWVTDDEINAIAEYLEKPIGEVRLMDARQAGPRVTLREYANGDCVYFDPKARRCTIYPVRPKQCRTWPFWPELISSRDVWDRTAVDCPGIGRRSVVPLEEVERIAADAGV